MIQELNERNRQIFRELVEAYVETGEPVGSQRLAQRLNIRLSPATIRGAMAELQTLGLLFAPHTSAGRVPTPQGLSFFVDGLLEVGNLTEDERASIEARCTATGRSVEEVMTEAVDTLSGLSRCAGLVVAPKRAAPVRHVEFVGLARDRVLAVIVYEDGQVENRLLETPEGWTPAALHEATNFLSSRLRGRTLVEIRDEIAEDLKQHHNEIDQIAGRLIEEGFATWAGGEPKDHSTLIVRGRANLLEDVHTASDLERLRELFSTLETKKGLLGLLDMARDAEGVRIYIGAADNLFNRAGCSVIIAPYADSHERIIGAIGVIGPTRLNYARIIPMVDFTAKMIGRVVG
ncbi:MAG: heat-inducible transcriptional repressor HrcA [Alphaproteobacteria bacterium]|nr:heat-inducible transcriptional repressor HrcA [Alphaproteobacteria bacterium]